MSHIINSLYKNIVDRAELMIFKGEFSWLLNVDILVFDELRLHQLDFICHSVRAAIANLRLPQVIATLNANTNKIEVALAEEVYTDRENTDQLIELKSAATAPYIISVGVCRDPVEGDIIVMDCDGIEIQCVDQILHVAIDKE